jgi:hypothetical protein
LRYDHLGTLARRDDLLLATGRLLDLGDVHVRLHRPPEVQGCDVQVVSELSFKRLDYQAAEYVAVPRHQYLSHAHRSVSSLSIPPNGPFVHRAVIPALPGR